MKNSIFYAAIRSLIITFFIVIGIGIAMIPLIVLMAALFSGKEEAWDKKTHYSATVLPNALNERKVLSSTAPIILKINIYGVIGGESLSMNDVKEMLIESREGSFGERVKAILVQIDSPGGTVIDADGIYRALKSYKEKYKIPIYAYVDGLCASGGMYVAMACDKIYANDASVIGSIGVISPSFFNFSGAMEKIGIESKTLYAGKGKDSLNPFRPWKEGEENNFKSLIDNFYVHFVDIVTSNRPKVNKANLIKDYGANVFPAQKALEIGYIDESGSNLDHALSDLVKSIGIDDDYYQVILMEKKFSLSDLFKIGSPMMKGTIKHQIELLPGIDAKLMNQFLYLYLPSS